MSTSIRTTTSTGVPRRAQTEQPFRDAGARGHVAQGDVDMFVRFDSALYKDPWISLDIYHSRYASPTGQTAAQPYRWKNADYDKIVDQVYQTPMDDQKKLLDLFRQAMMIWLPELPDIQITE